MSTPDEMKKTEVRYSVHRHTLSSKSLSLTPNLTSLITLIHSNVEVDFFGNFYPTVT